jgi:hypothetical protein
MPRLPRRPSPPRARGVAAGLDRMRAARSPRVTVRERGGQARTLDPADPRAEALLAAAERLLSAVQRGSGA